MRIKRDFYFKTEDKPRMLHIWLPDDYEESNERYPVMYFFDGHNLFYNEDATYGKSWGMKEFLEQWTKKMIIVGIECGHGPDERLSEYMPYPSVGRFSHIEPTGDATMQWIIEDLKPIIDKDYRTIPFRECTAIGGSSMGGLMAVYAAVHYNQWFSKAACVSSSIGFCMEPLMKDMKVQEMSADTRLYLSWGTREAHNIKDKGKMDTNSDTYHWNKQVAEQAESCGATVLMDCQVGGGHCEADWEKLVPTFMNFLWME